ncbi:YmfQ family protein [Lelliottia nimipressuralis]
MDTEQLTQNYQQQLQKLLPRGPAWSDNDPLLAGLAPAFAAVHERANDLVKETNPLQTVELLDRWESCCGLPDSCSVPGSETIAQRQQRLNTKVNMVGGITKDFYLQVLSDLGYPDATITTFAGQGFKANSPCTNGLYGYDWNFYWQVNFAQTTKVSSMTCRSRCNEPIRTWGDTVAECVITKLCPSHTIVLFSYPPEVVGASYRHANSAKG